MRKNIKSLFKTLAIFLVTGAVLGLFGIRALADDERLTVTFHYSRTDNDYSRWSLWLWEDNGEGSDNAFQGTDENGAWLQMTVDTKTSAIGYIIRTPEWEKDVDADRFIDVSGFISGNIDVYLSQGVETPEIVTNNVVEGAKITLAKYREDDDTITVKATIALEDSEKIQVLANSGDEVEIISITEDDNAEDENVYIIQLSGSLVAAKGYHILYNSKSYAITMPNIYSTEEFESEYTYEGDDLGAGWTEQKTTFKVWAPTADAVKVCFYAGGDNSVNDLREEMQMTKGEKGVWSAEKEGDLDGIYYTYKVTVDNEEVEAADPYARAAGVNGDRSMVINLDATDPEGWENDQNPNQGANQTDAIIYELSIRDFSMDESSGVSEANRGKYLAFTESGTTNAEGDTTGIDYLKNLGVTHIQLLPMQDFGSIDEKNPYNYNWGYGTKNFNVPEGSYSSDPYDGAVRIKEAKQMIQELHDNGMSVVMDVVYNHVFSVSEFCYNQIVPDYFTRISDEGVYSNGSYCGNDTASERSMVQKYIVDSILYWAEEYHVDGFRFDLAGVLDTDTINEIVAEVRKVNPSIILYGEGWTMPTVATKSGTTFATQVNAAQTPGFGYFDDRIRNRIKGNSNDTSGGYVTAGINASGIRLSVQGNAGWTKNPGQIINYVSAHDDAALWDKIRISSDGAYDVQIKQNKLASAVVFASQGTAFLHAGDEMLRSKVDEEGNIVYDSYESSDYVNSIKWNDLSKTEIQALSEYYQGLIAFRKAHPALRMVEASQISENLSFIDNATGNVVAYVLNGENVVGETSGKLLIAFNPNDSVRELILPEGRWDVCVNGEQAGTATLENVNGTLTMDEYSAYMLVQGEVDPSQQKVTVYYKTTNEFAHMGYGLFTSYGENWSGVDMEDSEYAGYKKIVLSTPYAESVQIYFKDRNDNYDNNGGENYVIGSVGSYVVANGAVRVGVPVAEEEAQEVTIYYKTADATNYMIYGLFGNSYDEGGYWSNPSILLEKSEYEGYKKGTMVISGAETVQVCFNDGGDNWDNNGGANYVIGVMGSYVIEDGSIRQGLPAEEEKRQVTVYYKTTDEVTNIVYGLFGGIYSDSGAWRGIVMKASDYEGYKEWMVVTNGAESIQVCFNDGNDNWDSNEGSNYLIGLAGSYVIEAGKVYAGNPEDKTLVGDNTGDDNTGDNGGDNNTGDNTGDDNTGGNTGDNIGGDDTDDNTGNNNTDDNNHTGTTQVGDLTCVDGKYYFYEDGIMAVSKEAYVNGAWRWFDADGTMTVDKDVYQYSSGGKWVRYNENGEMLKGEDYRYGGWYYFEPVTGTMMKGPVVLEDGRKVFYDTITGQMLKGEHMMNGETYIFDENDGHLISGTETYFWIHADGRDYWYEDWVKQGWNPADWTYRGKEIYDPGTDAWYWLDNVAQGGKAVSKDVYQESYSAYPDREDGTGKWVRYDENGHMVKGWQTTDAGTYYFEQITGAMAKGSVFIDGMEYYFDVITGIMQFNQ